MQKYLIQKCKYHHHVALLAWISLNLSCHVSIVYRSWKVFMATSRIRTDLLFLGSSWSSYLCSTMWRGPQEYIAYEFVLTSRIVPRMSGSSNFDSFRDGCLVAVQLLFCWVWPPGLVRYSSQHSCVIAVKLFLHMFSQHPCGASI